MAYPKKPTQLKILAGTARKDRDKGAKVDLPKVDSVPEAPSWLPNAHAVTEFNRLAAILFNNSLLHEVSVSALAHLAALHGKLLHIWSTGGIPSGHLMAQYRNLSNDFGLTPISCSKIGGAAPVKKKNAFANNGTRKRQQSGNS